MDPSSNFYNYRTALRGATQRSLTAHSNREKVCLQMNWQWQKGNVLVKLHSKPYSWNSHSQQLCPGGLIKNCQISLVLAESPNIK